MLVYKCLHQAAPIYLSEPCIPVATFAGRSHLRSAVKECLVIGYCKTKNYGQRSFSYSGPTLWNSLPMTVRDPSMSLLQFCARLKTEMFCRAYDCLCDSLGCKLLCEHKLPYIHTYIHVRPVNRFLHLIPQMMRIHARCTFGDVIDIAPHLWGHTKKNIWVCEYGFPSQTLKR